MRYPQVSDRVKEASAQALRGVFAGIGRLLLVTDKLRNKPPGQPPKAETGAPQQAAQPDEPGPDVLSPDVLSPDVLSPEAPGPDAPGPDAPSPDVAAADLPVPNYDELSVASLRARLRNLDIPQLRQLTRYEQAHAGRPEVITMYERRVAKLESERASADGAAAAQAQIAARAEVEDEVRAELKAEGD